MKKYMTAAKRKELLAKREYYREHPEEARKEYVKKFDGYVPIGIPPKNNSDKKDNK